MSFNIINNLLSIQQNIKDHSQDSSPEIIAVSKTFTIEHIKPLIDHGHVHFGENKLQEALSKWSEFKKKNENIKLHMIGKLQSNKAKKAIRLFDYIHSLDNVKLADILNTEERKTSIKLKYFIQVNLGSEKQKSGVLVEEIDEFYNYCKESTELDIPEKYFKILYEIGVKLKLKELSMGMSSDYVKALKYNSTFLRIGSSIFGSRTIK
jgi:pyridoxal phosphate enzyme (YggS family)